MRLSEQFTEIQDFSPDFISQEEEEVGTNASVAVVRKE